MMPTTGLSSFYSCVCVCVCAFVFVCFSQFGDAPGGSEQGRALPVLLPPVGGLPLNSGCRGSRASSYLTPWASFWGTRLWRSGVGLWIISPAPAPQLPCWQPLCNRDPGQTSQLHAALLVTTVLWDLLGEHSRTRGVCQVPSACSPEQGCPAGGVHLQRCGGGRELLRTPSKRGSPGNPLRPPECGGNYADHGEGVCLSGWEEEGREGAGGPHEVRNGHSWTI